MSRITLVELPEYEFSYPLSIRPSDVNQAGHLGNAPLVACIQEARLAFLKSLGLPAHSQTSMKIGMVIGDLAVNFKAEAYINDQITIDCFLDEIREKSFRLYYRVRRGEQVIALAETGMIAFSPQEKKAAKLPRELVDGITEFKKRNI